MIPIRIVGIVLIIVGVIVLAYGGFTYKSHTKSIKVGSAQASVSTHNSIPLPPIAGGVLIVVGVLLTATFARRT